MKKRSNGAVMFRMLSVVKPLTPVMICAILLGVAGFVCANFITILGAYGILSITGHVQWSLSMICILMAVAAVLRGILHYGEQACNHYIAFKLLASIRDKIFGKLRELCPAKLEGKDKGNLISLITSDIELLEVFYAHTISPIVIACFMTLIMTGFIGHFHWVLGLYAFVAYLLVGLALPLWISRISGKTGKELRDQTGKLGSFLLESLRGLKEVIQYGCGEDRIREMNDRTDRLNDTAYKAKQAAGKGMTVTGGLVLILSLGMFFLSVCLMEQGEMGFSQVLLATTALFSSFGPVTALANLGSTLQTTLASARRVFELLDEEPVVKEQEGEELAHPETSGEILFEQVGFSYETGEGTDVIFRDFSLQVPENQVLGIVGKSGCGKSTLLKLLMRFWDVKQGAIKLGKTDVRDMATSSLRHLESYVTQETHLFHDSIANNLKLGKNKTEKELIEACKKASVHDFIMSLPEKYDTAVGELGDTLSGGERQRLGIARAFLHQAPLLLLDEPTSNLDSLNEGIILQSLEKEKGKRTVILVSHRTSTMSVADKVISMEQGRVS